MMKKLIFALAFLALAGSAWADLALNTSLRTQASYPLDFTNSSDYDTPSSAFSFSSRFYKISDINFLSDGTDAGGGFYCTVTAGLCFSISVGGSVVVLTSTAFNSGAWNLVTVTKDNTGVWHVYINGSEASYTTHTTANTSTRGTHHLLLGSDDAKNFPSDSPQTSQSATAKSARTSPRHPRESVAPTVAAAAQLSRGFVDHYRLHCGGRGHVQMVCADQSRHGVSIRRCAGCDSI